MAIFRKEKAKADLIGNTEPVCPSCSHSMTKMPARKTKCPNCGNHVYVRTRPVDRRKVLLTKEQLNQVEPLWTMLYDVLQAEIQEWSVLNQLLSDCARKGNWGIYRNTRFSMAQAYTRARDYRTALETLLQVSYLDANGPENLNGLKNPLYPPFKRKFAFQAAAIVEYIQILSDWLDLNAEDLKELYFQLAPRLRRDLDLPVSPQVGWHDLEVELARNREDYTKLES